VEGVGVLCAAATLAKSHTAIGSVLRLRDEDMSSLSSSLPASRADPFRSRSRRGNANASPTDRETDRGHELVKEHCPRGFGVHASLSVTRSGGSEVALPRATIKVGTSCVQR
jgi:hypothetical protein